MEYHNAHSNHLHIQDNAQHNHCNGDGVVEKENIPIAVGPQESNVHKVVRNKHHEVNLLKAGEDARRGLLELLSAVDSVNAAETIGPTIDCNCSNYAGRAVVNHVETTVNEFFGVFWLDEPGDAFQHQSGHEDTVDGIDHYYTHKGRKIAPVYRGHLVQDVHLEKWQFV